MHKRTCGWCAPPNCIIILPCVYHVHLFEVCQRVSVRKQVLFDNPPVRCCLTSLELCQRRDALYTGAVVAADLQE